MGIYRPSELRQFLRSLGREPKKSLSQNFLIDANIIKKILRVADIKTQETVIEIGSGPGALTEALLAASAQVIAIETDRVLAKELERLQTPSQSLRVWQADALHISLDELPLNVDPHKNKLLGNLPYHIASALLGRFVTQHKKLSRIVVTVQEEMARRMTAQPKTAEYGSFTLFSHFYADLKYAFKIGRHCFYPTPRVDSAVVVLDLKPPPTDIDEQLFFRLTRTAFEQRRKPLRSSLKELFQDRIVKALEKLHLPPLSRPEELSFDEWLELSRYLNP